ncbi:MAG: hypothetical protein WCJ66_13600, partial [Verrucomicrobiota bacterium]
IHPSSIRHPSVIHPSSIRHPSGSIASSADGTKLAAGAMGGQIYVGDPKHFSAGSQGTMATFRYTGKGRWTRMVDLITR